VPSGENEDAGLVGVLILVACEPIEQSTETTATPEEVEQSSNSAETSGATTTTLPEYEVLSSELPDRVAAVEVIEEFGGRVSWSPDGQWILFDKLGEDGYFDIWLMRPDGTDRTCLTCDVPAEIAPQRTTAPQNGILRVTTLCSPPKSRITSVVRCLRSPVSVYTTTCG